MFQDHELDRVVSQRNKHRHGKQITNIFTYSERKHTFCVFFGAVLGVEISPSRRLQLSVPVLRFGGLEAPGESRLECQGGRQW